ncbi:MAG: TusE/DsrC/DsvC family sulfur relay protein [Chloroflexi bacterium]|jgi:dissimilatory sulfite reductase related protein|nr:TusE/DsrC/DsvC family sulfur relay protein [Chloroflexota bacterium]MBT3670895.1 TusE/DsrC/DsvC family sulfur relay protein [Chloroflexota bacterium]MBT4002916.1 TusE/DsrC/DsvC family sulfur relay protein [Chloroflexota bacterium]MBT4306391.1 TusE/DsrC/DsvC family sulfur relay protein [Chloroflexota bacterium]MBT4532728.1 TusE/DsrC/DsvC family sulfur relay protein [Chloroflexota bacterium]
MPETIDLTILETLDFDDDGFMTDANDWTPAIGKAIAAALELELTERHWDVINFSRAEFAEHGDAPSLRKITKVGGVPTKELYVLFPGGPAKLAAQIAGLPKPTGCI